MKPTSILLAGLLVVAAAASTTHATPFGERTQPTQPDAVTDDLAIKPILVKTLPRKPFKVGRVGEIGAPKREALVAVFTTFQSQYTVDDRGKIVSAAPWADSSLATLSATIHQPPVEGFYLLGSTPANHALFQRDAAEPYEIGTTLKVIVYRAGEQAWIDPTGATQKSPLYRELSLPLKQTTPRPPTREQFLASLRAGQKFDLLTKEGDTLVIQSIEW